MRISSSTVPSQGRSVWFQEPGNEDANSYQVTVGASLWSQPSKKICSSSIIWQGCPLKESHVICDEVMFLPPRTVPGEIRKVPRTEEWDCELLLGHGWSKSIQVEQGENIRAVNMSKICKYFNRWARLNCIYIYNPSVRMVEIKSMQRTL